MKSQVSLTAKLIFIILTMAIILFVSYQLIIFTYSSEKAKAHEEILLKANDKIQALISNQACLAYQELGKIENHPKEFSTQKVIDGNKLDYFALNFFDVQPDCAKDFRYGYRIRVETFPINISTQLGKVKSEIFPRIFKLIDGKKSIFSLDVSGSMAGYSGDCDVDEIYPNSKICCLKKFMYGFIDQMKPESQIAVNVFGTQNYVGWIISPLTEIDNRRDELKSYIEPLVPQDGTPMCIGLEEAFKLAINENGDAIILLTDGVENVGCTGRDSTEVAKSYSNSKIPVYAVGFGASSDMKKLEDVARITGGIAFYAETCEELVSKGKTINVSVPKKVWEFGDLSFSKEDALREDVRLTFPVIVVINSSTFLSGIIQIRMVSGELEEIRGGVEDSCLNNLDKTSYYEFSYPVTIKTGAVCMQFKDEEVCQKLSCKKDIETKSIPAGRYSITFKNRVDKLEVLV